MNGHKKVGIVAITCVRLLASIVLTSTVLSEANPDAKLLHFDMPASERIPGVYYVLFKTEQELSLRIDSDVIEWFKKQGAGYQSRMNALLRAYVEAHK